MEESTWRPVTDDLMNDPHFSALGRDAHGDVFKFWNGGGDWLRDTSDGDCYSEDLCFPVEWQPLTQAGLIHSLVREFFRSQCDGTYTCSTSSWSLELVPGANGTDPVGDFVQAMSCFLDARMQGNAYQQGFQAAVEMIRDKDDKYGIGNMFSQWTSEEIADDLLERAGMTSAHS